MKTTLIISISLFFFISCSISVEPINYNYDECAYCKMKISDVRFGAELVTEKGKIFKYDSAECLVRTYIENENPNYAFMLVTDYSRPHTLIDAVSANFFISEQQPSPMGGNLSAYEDTDVAKNAFKEKGGSIISFEQLVTDYKDIYQ